MKTIVIGLGGNALLSPAGGQGYREGQRNMARVARSIVSLAKRYRVVITHGNGTQVGDELVRNIMAGGKLPPLPLYAMTAETQGAIGSEIALALSREIRRQRAARVVSCVLTHVVVSKEDGAFSRPTKPIGPRLSAADASRYRRKGMGRIKSGGGYRLTVASPQPLEILELEAIMRSPDKEIVIACGGGGIPVSRSGRGFDGADAVIDKDRTTALLAESLDAEAMVILTDARFVYADHPKDRMQIVSVPAKSLKRSLGRFEEGSIRPKIEAAVRFAERTGRAAYIGNLFELDGILKGDTGTRVY